MTIIEIWQRRQSLSWSAKRLRSAPLTERLTARLARIEAEADECLRSLEVRIGKFTLRTRQLEVRPNLQLFLLLPSVVLELKAASKGLGGRSDPFIRLRISGVGVTVSSYEGGDISVLLGVHAIRVDGFERSHPAAKQAGKNMVGGYGYGYANKLRGKYGSGSGRAARLPMEWDEGGNVDMASVLVVVGEGGEASDEWEFLVRHFEVNIVPLVVTITKSQ
ncbi:hypothetical protein TrRE_jg889, partial [Triparma retinervis]